MNRRALLCLLILALSIFAPAPPARALSGRININSASAKELASLPFIGKKRARDIIGLRRHLGPFSKAEDLLAAGSIGPLTLAAISPYIKFSGQNTIHRKSALDSHRTIITRPGQIMLLADREFFPVLSSMIDSAHRSIDIGMYFFKSGKGKTNRLIKALTKARRRGVAVRVMLEDSAYNDELDRENRITAKRLGRAGIKVRFDTPRPTTHVKAVVIDHRFTFICSHNLTNSALGHNHELSLLIDDRTLAAQVSDYLKLIFR